MVDSGGATDDRRPPRVTKLALIGQDGTSGPHQKKWATVTVRFEAENATRVSIVQDSNTVPVSDEDLNDPFRGELLLQTTQLSGTVESAPMECSGIFRVIAENDSGEQVVRHKWQNPIQPLGLGDLVVAPRRFERGSPVTFRWSFEFSDDWPFERADLATDAHADFVEEDAGRNVGPSGEVGGLVFAPPFRVREWQITGDPQVIERRATIWLNAGGCSFTSYARGLEEVILP